MTDGDDRSDPDTRDLLREVAEEIRGESSESRQVAAMVYRVSDLYDDAEETTPRDVYVNMKNILQVKEQGGKDPDPEGL
ncbi:MAG: hypothetical protein V5A23_08075 [Halobacteriales archaeon]